ncbi:MAG: hypothetical protein ACFFCS_13675 [Candidatus Hodarchaeota archaeon]
MNTLNKVLFTLGYVAGFILLGLGAIFLMGSLTNTVRNITIGIIFIAIGMVLLVGLRLRQRVVVEQKVTLKPTQIKKLQCKECGAQLSEKDFTIKNDIVIVKCTYCGALYEMADEPIW